MIPKSHDNSMYLRVNSMYANKLITNLKSYKHKIIVK